jgi:Protein of unknown function (DUF3829)
MTAGWPKMRSMRRRMALWMLMTAALAAGCKEDPPPPPMSSARPLARTPPPMLTAPPLEPISPLGRREGPRLKKATMKRYRAEVCYFGSLGVPYARESYWSSLGSDDPTPINIPNFGTYPEHEPRKPGGRIPLAAKMGRLPFEHHLRACASAKALAKGKWSELDEALETFDAVASVAARTLGDAARYYAREEHRRDDFRKGRELHQKLSDELASFEEAHAAYGVVFRKWVAGVEEFEEAKELDEGGKLSAKALSAARQVAFAFLEKDTPAQDELEPHMADLKAALSALKSTHEADRKPPHPRLVAPKLEALIARVESTTKLDAESRYRLARAYAAVVDADQRALSLLIGGDDPFGAMGRPRLPELTPLTGRKKMPTKALKVPTKPPAKPE